MLGDARRDDRQLALAHLKPAKGNDEHYEEHQENDDAGVAPGVARAAPLQRQEQADDGGDEEGGADGVELPQLLLQRQVAAARDAGRLEEEEDAGDGDGADGQVDVEAPTPADVIGEGSTEQRAGDGGDAVHGAYEAGVDGSLAQRNRVGDDDERPGEDAGGADAGDGTANDERIRRRCSAAHQRAKFEDADGAQKDPLDGEEGVKLAEHQLEGTAGVRARASVPARAVGMSRRQSTTERQGKTSGLTRLGRGRRFRTSPRHRGLESDR